MHKCSKIGIKIKKVGLKKGNSFIVKSQWETFQQLQEWSSGLFQMRMKGLQSYVMATLQKGNSETT